VQVKGLEPPRPLGAADFEFYRYFRSIRKLVYFTRSYRPKNPCKMGVPGTSTSKNPTATRSLKKTILEQILDVGGM